MLSDHSVTQWLGGLKSGSDDAVEKLWDRYFERIVGLARSRMKKLPTQLADEEDIALSVFKSLCRGASAGRLDRVADRRDLWRLLIALTQRKTIDQIRWDHAEKRGNGKVQNASQDGPGISLAEVVSRDPTPEDLARMEDTYRHLVRLLDPEAQRVASLRMEGYSIEEIAKRIARSMSFVERKLRLTRRLWEREFASE